MGDFWKQAVAAHDHRLVVSLLATGLRLDEARDVAQETWLRVMEAAAAGKLERLEFPGLLIRQASFIVADRARVTRARPTVGVEAVAEVAGCDSPEATTSAGELMRHVRNGLATITPRERDVFTAVMRHPDQAHLSLAGGEGVSLQRFRQLLCSARSKLRALMEAAS